MIKEAIGRVVRKPLKKVTPMNRILTIHILLRLFGNFLFRPKDFFFTLVSEPRCNQSPNIGRGQIPQKTLEKKGTQIIISSTNQTIQTNMIPKLKFPAETPPT